MSADPLKEHLPERAHDYYTGPEWDTGIADAADDSLLAGHDPHSLYGGSPHTIGRSYDSEIVEEQYLGYAPRGSLIRHRLLKDGHSVEQLLATGLFVPDPHSTADVYEDYEDGDSEYTAEDLADKDLKGDLADEDHPLEAKDLIRPRWKGRYIFPFMLPAEDLETLDDIFEFPFDVAETDIEAAATDDGKVPIFAYSRAQPHRIHPNDWRGSKYEKLKLTEYVYAHEAIYGIDSLRPGEPAIITEGVADAIAAKMHDLPVLSPVTTKIKSQHHEPLLELIEAYDVSGIYLIQDNEASNFAREEPGTLTPEDVDDITAHLTKRDSILDSDSQDLESHVEAWTDDDRDASLELIDSRGDLAGGPLSPFLSIDPVSPGLDGALRTGRFLHQNDIRTLHIDLPQLATEKVDLDDYLTMGLHEHIPIFSGLQTLRWSLTARTEAALLQSLFESAAFTTAYQDGTTRLKNQLADHREIAPDTPEYEQLDIWNTTELGNSVPVEYRDDGTVDIPAPFEGNDGEMTYPTGDTKWKLKDDLTQRQILGVAHQTVSAAEDGSVPTPEQTLADILEASLDITVPATFDETILGELLAMGSPVAAVEELSENPHPRQPTHTTTPTAIRNRAESVADADGNSDGSDESQPANDDDTAGADGERETLADLFDPMNVGRTKPTAEFVPLFDPPKVVVPTHHTKFEEVMESHTNQQTQSIAADGSGGSGTASGDYSELYELELSDLVGKSPRYRGPNPLAHTGESRDYFLLSGDDFAYDFKRDAVFNALFYLAVEAKCRRVNDPEGSFDAAEHLAVWLHAKDQGYISSDDAIPNKALNQAAVEAGVADWSDIGAKTVETADGTIQFEAALPDDKYNEILEVFEDEFGVSPGRGQKVTEATFEVEGLTTEESAREFAQRYLTTDVDESDILDDYDYDYPRIAVKTVWETYQNWCELNGIEHKNEYQGAKSDIADELGVEKAKAKWPGSDDRPMCYTHTKFNSEGYALQSQFD